MIILDKPYVSKEIKEYLEQSQIPVLKNDTSITEGIGYNINLKEKDEFISNLKNIKRLYTLSENSIEWIYQNIPDKELIKNINIMKDKVKFRDYLKDLYPDFLYKEVKLEELINIEFTKLPLPFVIKPSVGFFSVGVYVITNLYDWTSAITEILKNIEEWKKLYPTQVIDNSTYILEEFISGDEYAIDAFYDDCGNATILNIMKHDFYSSSDVSDRLYYTSKDIIEKQLNKLTEFLNKVNKKINAKNFPFHAEVRIDKSKIVPIEFNPMRFAGWCCTDLTYFAFGFKTYDYYFNNIKPDWKELLKKKENKIYSLIVLDKYKDYKKGDTLNYNLLSEYFKKILCLRKLDPVTNPVFGFIFTETNAENIRELENIVNSDLKEFSIIDR
ncbi:MAG: ATP-grasp domain-containing protein [Firmicutes bacterium]|nr:ATP-grasp domain-containing protein [Bacillota bacterium]